MKNGWCNIIPHIAIIFLSIFLKLKTVIRSDCSNNVSWINNILFWDQWILLFQFREFEFLIVEIDLVKEFLLYCTEKQHQISITNMAIVGIHNYESCSLHLQSENLLIFTALILINLHRIQGQIVTLLFCTIYLFQVH